jgi:hypothetical protein
VTHYGHVTLVLYELIIIWGFNKRHVRSDHVLGSPALWKSGPVIIGSRKPSTRETFSKPAPFKPIAPRGKPYGLVNNGYINEFLTVVKNKSKESKPVYKFLDISGIHKSHSRQMVVSTKSLVRTVSCIGFCATRILAVEGFLANDNVDHFDKDGHRHTSVDQDFSVAAL